MSKTPHTACYPGKRVRVVLIDGTKFEDRFQERNPKWVYFKQRGKVRRSTIKAFSIIKGEKTL